MTPSADLSVPALRGADLGLRIVPRRISPAVTEIVLVCDAGSLRVLPGGFVGGPWREGSTTVVSRLPLLPAEAPETWPNALAAEVNALFLRSNALEPPGAGPKSPGPPAAAVTCGRAVISDPCFWAPGEAFLYRLSCTVADGAGREFTIDDRLGLRFLEVPADGRPRMGGLPWSFAAEAVDLPDEAALAGFGGSGAIAVVRQPSRELRRRAAVRGIPLALDLRGVEVPAAELACDWADPAVLLLLHDAAAPLPPRTSPGEPLRVELPPGLPAGACGGLVAGPTAGSLRWEPWPEDTAVRLPPEELRRATGFLGRLRV